MEHISAEDQETIREFLVESHENLSRLDQDLVELEKHPRDADLLGSIFRTIHTIKGACGFLSFTTLEGISHQAESLLSQLRNGKRELTPALVSLILETVDATRQVMASIEASGTEGGLLFDDLTERLRLAAELDASPAAPPLPTPATATSTPTRAPVRAAVAAPPPEPAAPAAVAKSSSKVHEDGPAEERQQREKDGRWCRAAFRGSRCQHSGWGGVTRQTDGSGGRAGAYPKPDSAVQR